MNVRELIEKLSTVDPDLPLLTYDPGADGYTFDVQALLTTHYHDDWRGPWFPVVEIGTNLTAHYDDQRML